MEPEQPTHSTRRRNRDFGEEFRFGRDIDKWQDFKSTWRAVPFGAQLNDFTREELSNFWSVQLDILVNQTEKICILVPSEVALPQPKPTQQTEETQPKKEEAKGKKGNRFQKKKVARVPLKKEVVEVCQELIEQKYHDLGYDFASLFMGNSKQLLVFRECNQIIRYLEKYRLPLDFKDHMEGLEAITAQLYETKIKRNRVISVFAKSANAKKVMEEYQLVSKQLEDAFKAFSGVFRNILTDFKDKKRCREIVIRSIRDELKEPIKELCKQFYLQVINRFFESSSDEVKDLLVIYPDDYRLHEPVVEDYQETEPQSEYVYESVPKEKQPPKDIRNLELSRIDFQKQCYCYTLDLPGDQGISKLEGVFIRSGESEDKVYELTIEITEPKQEIEVEIYPYRVGKSTYELYTYNSEGFTKCSENIVIYNQLQLTGTDEPRLTDYSVNMLGKSESGLLIDKQSTEGEISKVKYSGVAYKAKSLSVGNGLVLCDRVGDVAGWGQMYSDTPRETNENKQDQENILEQQAFQNIVVEKPCLLLSNRHIRKVSCGSGYFLMLSRFGSVWSMGFNHFGQLGLGNLNTDIDCTQPREMSWSGSDRPFMVDIKGTVCGASFAWDDKGSLYRWGWNQVEETNHPITDRFGSVVNYQTQGLIYKQPNQTKVSRSLIRGDVKQVDGGYDFCMALTTEGQLYGWGDCIYLGREQLLDLNERKVRDIVLPIQVMKDIEWFSCGFGHVIAGTKSGKVIAWGETRGFSQEKGHKHEQLPIDITDIIKKRLGPSTLKQTVCGNKYTALATKEGEVMVLGEANNFECREFKCTEKILDMQVSHESCIALLTKNNTP